MGVFVCNNNRFHHKNGAGNVCKEPVVKEGEALQRRRKLPTVFKGGMGRQRSLTKFVFISDYTCPSMTVIRIWLMDYLFGKGKRDRTGAKFYWLNSAPQFWASSCGTLSFASDKPNKTKNTLGKKCFISERRLSGRAEWVHSPRLTFPVCDQR